MRYLFNIGNSHTQIAREDASGIELLTTLPTAELLRHGTVDLLECQSGAWSARAASVVPAAQKLLQTRYPGHFMFISAVSYPWLDFSLYDIRTLGADRIANAAAAQALGSGAVLVLDCGTCISTEAIDAKGVFRGGAIMPGRAMLRKSLASFTAQLPEIPMSMECPSALGQNTAEAIAAGVDLGVIGAMREIVEKTRRQTGLEKCRVIAVGGDAKFFIQNIDGLEPGTANFTLHGISLAKD
jgi:type III pantothenate kinase